MHCSGAFQTHSPYSTKLHGIHCYILIFFVCNLLSNPWNLFFALQNFFIYNRFFKLVVLNIKVPVKTTDHNILVGQADAWSSKLPGLPTHSPAGLQSAARLITRHSEWQAATLGVTALVQWRSLLNILGGSTSPLQMLLLTKKHSSRNRTTQT